MGKQLPAQQDQPRASRTLILTPGAVSLPEHSPNAWLCFSSLFPVCPPGYWEKMQRGEKQRDKMERTLHQVTSFPQPLGWESLCFPPAKLSTRQLNTHTWRLRDHKSHKPLTYKPNAPDSCCSLHQGSQNTKQTRGLVQHGCEDAPSILTPAQLPVSSSWHGER